MTYPKLAPFLSLLLLATGGCSDDSGFSDADAAVDGAPPLVDGPRPDRNLADTFIGPPVTFSVATFNVENFFDDQDDPDHKDDVPSTSLMESKIRQLGEALRYLEADVVALQEVENKALLDRLNKEELGSLGYEHVRLVEGNDIRGIDVALLSRYPVPRAESHKWDTFPGVDGDTTTYGFSRDCLEATIEPSPGRKLILLINHLRAQGGTESDLRRYAQANRVREIADDVLRYHPDANLAVLGDLNDVPTSKTLSLIQSGSPALFDLLTLVPAAERYTVYYGSKKQYDYILVSPGLKADLVAGSVSAEHSSVFRDTSDHYPVKARFRLE